MIRCDYLPYKDDIIYKVCFQLLISRYHVIITHSAIKVWVATVNSKAEEQL